MDGAVRQDGFAIFQPIICMEYLPDKNKGRIFAVDIIFSQILSAMVNSVSVHRLLACLGAIISLVSVGVAQPARLKKVEKVTDITEGKYYVVAATVDGQMYAMQALERGSKSDGQFLVENVTSRPSLLDEDNLFYFSAGTKSSGYRQRKFYSKTRGQVSNDGNGKIAIGYAKATVKDFYIDERTGQDGLQLHLGKNANRPVAMWNTCEYCKGYGDTGSDKCPMFIYECVELPSVATPIGTVEIKTSEGYATYFNTQSYVLPEGVKAATVNDVDWQKGELVLDWIYSAGDVVPGSTGLLLYGAQGAYTLYAPRLEEDEPTMKSPSVAFSDSNGSNLLLGSDEDSETAGLEDGAHYAFYKLSYLTDVDTQERTLGFFWGASAGASFTNKANHAYLALKCSSGSVAKGFRLPSSPYVSGMKGVVLTSLDASDSDTIYTLSGTLLKGKEWSTLPAGVYVINRRKVVKR